MVLEKDGVGDNDIPTLSEWIKQKWFRNCAPKNKDSISHFSKSLKMYTFTFKWQMYDVAIVSNGRSHVMLSQSNKIWRGKRLGWITGLNKTSDFNTGGGGWLFPVSIRQSVLVSFIYNHNRFLTITLTMTLTKLCFCIKLSMALSYLKTNLFFKCQ